MQPTNNHATDMGATEIFRMPSADATVPDLMAEEKPAHPTLTIVKGPQIGETFELDAPIITLGRDPRTWVDGAIVSKASLKDGSTIQIGTFRMVFHTNARPRRIDAEG